MAHKIDFRALDEFGKEQCDICITCRCRKLKNLVGKLIIFSNTQTQPQRIKGLVLECCQSSSASWGDFCSFYFVDSRSVEHCIGTPFVDMKNIVVLPLEENLIFRLEYNISIK